MHPASASLSHLLFAARAGCRVVEGLAESFSLFSVFSLRIHSWAPLAELEGKGLCEHYILYDRGAKH